jgi:hypothetical protein
LRASIRRWELIQCLDEILGIRHWKKSCPEYEVGGIITVGLNGCLRSFKKWSGKFGIGKLAFIKDVGGHFLFF